MRNRSGKRTPHSAAGVLAVMFDAIQGGSVGRLSLEPPGIGDDRNRDRITDFGNDAERFIFYAFDKLLPCDDSLSLCKRHKYFPKEDDTLQLPRVRKAFLLLKEQCSAPFVYRKTQKMIHKRLYVY